MARRLCRGRGRCLQAALASREAIRSTSWPRPWPELRCLELGCGAGFPSLVAARLGATVYALDTEQLTLDGAEPAAGSDRGRTSYRRPSSDKSGR